MKINLCIDTFSTQGKTLLIEKEGAIQSSIRMGKHLMTRKHPDYFPMLLLNEILGGYFGSRLMKNIREEKGLTYGISSNLALFTQAGYFVIGTDVKREFTQQTIDEIQKEIKILQTELVSENELETVKNYMVGSFAGSLNTPFDIADRYKVIFSENLPLDFYKNYIPNIQQISAIQLLETANKYLGVRFIDRDCGGRKIIIQKLFKTYLSKTQRFTTFAVLFRKWLIVIDF